MSANPQNRQRQRDRSGENFKKRWRTLIKNGYEIYRDYVADVYILLRRKGQTYIFKSTDKKWPLSPDDIQGSFPVPVQVTAADIASQKKKTSEKI
ncbi:hypothetical protein V8C37DRAFT_397014 [Trichoderma ceciliae]